MLKKIINNTMVKDIVAIVIGCIITAFAINNILVPNALSTSGITGLALIAQKYTGINYTYMYYVFSIIILISSLIFLGKKDFLKILFVSIFYPTLLLCMNSIAARLPAARSRRSPRGPRRARARDPSSCAAVPPSPGR